jgi:hypothetical protein
MSQIKEADPRLVEMAFRYVIESYSRKARHAMVSIGYLRIIEDNPSIRKRVEDFLAGFYSAQYLEQNGKDLPTQGGHYGSNQDNKAYNENHKDYEVSKENHRH